MAYSRKRSRSRKYSTSRRRSGKSNQMGNRVFQSRVRSAVLKTAETKYYDVADENVQLYHNNGTNSLPGNPAGLSTLFNPWADISKGTGRQERIGDKITPRGMALKIWIANKLDRPNVMYRIILARLPKTLAGSAVTNSNVFAFQNANLGATGNLMISPLDSDRGIRPLYDKVFNNQMGHSVSGVNLKECHMYKKLWIKSRKARNIVYDSAGQFIVNNPLIIYIIPYDSYGTVVTDNIASCSYYARMYYKDI